MMSFKKLAKYALTGSLAFGLVAGAGTISTFAAAEEGGDVPVAATKPTVDVDYGSAVLNIEKATSDTSEYAYIGIDNNGKVSVWERVEFSKGEKVIEVPVSGVSFAKEVKFKIYLESAINEKGVVDTNLIQEVKIVALPKKVQAKFVPNDSEIKGATVTLTVDGTTLKTKDKKFEFRDAYLKAWESSESLTPELIDQYATYGATLIVRQKAEDKLVGGVAAEGVTAEHFASKEVKVKIPKKANGPKAVVNPLTLTVSVPAKSEWRIIGATGDNSIEGIEKDSILTATAENKSGWIKQDAKANLTVKDLTGKLATGVTASVLDGVTIEVKTVATDKKLGSKIGFVKIPAQTAAPAIGSDKDYTLEFAFDKNKTKVTGVKVTNKKSDKTLQVAVVEKSSLNEDPTTHKLSVKADTDYSTTKFTAVKGKPVTIPTAKAGDGKALVIRFAGTKATKTNVMVLASDMDAQGITYPKAAEALAGVTVGKGTNVGTVKITTGTKAPDGKAFAYKLSDTEVKAIKLEAKITDEGVTKDNLGADAAVAEDNITTTVGKYVVVYQYDATTKFIEKFVCVKVSEVTTPTPTPVVPTV